MMIGKIVKVTVDRSLESYHPEYKEMQYPINYGYIKGIMAPENISFTKEEIFKQTYFQEQYFDSKSIM